MGDCAHHRTPPSSPFFDLFPAYVALGFIPPQAAPGCARQSQYGAYGVKCKTHVLLLWAQAQARSVAPTLHDALCEPPKANRVQQQQQYDQGPPW